jgi:hypothetical protein
VSGVDVVHLFLQYVEVLAPVLVPLVVITIVSSWLKKLVDAMSGKDW